MLLAFTGIFLLIGAAVFTGITARDNPLSINWSIGFGFAWAGVGVTFLAGNFNQISAYYMECNTEEDEGKEVEA